MVRSWRPFLHSARLGASVRPQPDLAQALAQPRTSGAARCASRDDCSVIAHLVRVELLAQHEMQCSQRFW
jgi:hypothetical protein